MLQARLTRDPVTRVAASEDGLTIFGEERHPLSLADMLASMKFNGTADQGRPASSCPAKGCNIPGLGEHSCDAVMANYAVSCKWLTNVLGCDCNGCACAEPKCPVLAFACAGKSCDQQIEAHPEGFTDSNGVKVDLTCNVLEDRFSCVCSGCSKCPPVRAPAPPPAAPPLPTPSTGENGPNVFAGLRGAPNWNPDGAGFPDTGRTPLWKEAGNGCLACNSWRECTEDTSNSRCTQFEIDLPNGRVTAGGNQCLDHFQGKMPGLWKCSNGVKQITKRTGPQKFKVGDCHVATPQAAQTAKSPALTPQVLQAAQSGDVNKFAAKATAFQMCRAKLAASFPNARAELTDELFNHLGVKSNVALALASTTWGENFPNVVANYGQIRAALGPEETARSEQFAIAVSYQNRERKVSDPAAYPSPWMTMQGVGEEEVHAEDYNKQCPSSSFPKERGWPTGLEWVKWHAAQRQDSRMYQDITQLPWPLSAFSMPLPTKECDFAVAAASDMNWYKYTRNGYLQKSVRCRATQRNPGHIDFIREKGGICGQLSYIELARRSCHGEPGMQVVEPGHSAALYFKRKKSGADNIGKNCWGGCGAKEGFCTFCGTTGACCKRGQGPAECRGITSQVSWGHECVEVPNAPTPAPGIVEFSVEMIHHVGDPSTAQWRIPLEDPPSDSIAGTFAIFYKTSALDVQTPKSIQWHYALARAMRDGPIDKARIAGIAAAHYGKGLSKAGSADQRRDFAPLLAAAVREKPDLFDLWELAGRWQRDGHLSSSLPQRPSGAPQSLLQVDRVENFTSTFTAIVLKLGEDALLPKVPATFGASIKEARRLLRKASDEDKSTGIGLLEKLMSKIPVARVNRRSATLFAKDGQLLEWRPARRIMKLLNKFKKSNASQNQSSLTQLTPLEEFISSVRRNPEKNWDRVIANDDEKKQAFAQWLKQHRAAADLGDLAREGLTDEDNTIVDRATVVDRATAATGTGTTNPDILEQMEADAEEGAIFTTVDADDLFEQLEGSPGNEGIPDEDDGDEDEELAAAASLLEETSRNQASVSKWPDEVQSWLSDCVDTWLKNAAPIS